MKVGFFMKVEMLLSIELWMTNWFNTLSTNRRSYNLGKREESILFTLKASLLSMRQVRILKKLCNDFIDWYELFFVASLKVKTDLEKDLYFCHRWILNKKYSRGSTTLVWTVNLSKHRFFAPIFQEFFMLPPKNKEGTKTKMFACRLSMPH